MKKMTLALTLALLFTASANAVESIEMHQHAVMAQEMMNNAQAPAHQQMINAHKKQAGEQAAAVQHGVSFSEMNEHERAAIVQESVNNSSAYAHQVLAAKHRQQIPMK